MSVVLNNATSREHLYYNLLSRGTIFMPRGQEMQGRVRRFGVLAMKGSLDLTVEALVVREPWRQLFTEAEFKTAKKRLR